MTSGISSIGSSYYNTTSTDKADSATDVSKDEFLKLLTYQLKAQNPLNPYNNQEFASQLAQFSQLEQLTEISSLLEEQVQANYLLSQTMSNSALPGLLGKNAKASSTTTYFDGENSTALGYTLSSQATSATLTIKDSAGNTIRTMELSGTELTSGDHKLEWNGLDNEGETVSEGNYTFEVKANIGNSSSYTADTFVYGKIEAVRFKSEGTVLVINGMEVALENVTDITTS